MDRVDWILGGLLLFLLVMLGVGVWAVAVSADQYSDGPCRDVALTSEYTSACPHAEHQLDATGLTAVCRCARQDGGR